MWDVSTVLIWAFGLAMAVMMLGSAMSYRHGRLTRQLREHVRRQLGRPLEEPESPAEEVAEDGDSDG